MSDSHSQLSSLPMFIAAKLGDKSAAQDVSGSSSSSEEEEVPVKATRGRAAATRNASRKKKAEVIVISDEDGSSSEEEEEPDRMDDRRRPAARRTTYGVSNRSRGAAVGQEPGTKLTAKQRATAAAAAVDDDGVSSDEGVSSADQGEEAAASDKAAADSKVHQKQKKRTYMELVAGVSDAIDRSRPLPLQRREAADYCSPPFRVSAVSMCRSNLSLSLRYVKRRGSRRSP